MKLMFELHADQTRKGVDTPYITHLLTVAATVGEFGGDEDQFIAALLHDAVEDQGGAPTLVRIREQFGARVANFVEGCTDAYGKPKPPWRERKEKHIEKIRHAAPEQRLIVIADKLHNATSILRDLRQSGPSVWDRFTAKRDGSLWYYEAMLDALDDGWSHPLVDELRETIRSLKAAA
jgi:(p)ppGpp synthase/HD superfamily hydrolase